MNAESAPICEIVDWLGRSVVLLPEQWRHIGESHPDLPDKLGGIEAVIAAIAHTVQTPDEVRGDSLKPPKACAYRRLQLVTGQSRWLRVIIWYGEGEPGLIRTAHLLRKPERKEVPLWP